MTVAWIIGLGNPGAKYEGTRHNAGFWLCDELHRHCGGSPWLNERKFFGEVSRVTIGGQEVKLLKPDTFMNRSGQAAQAVAQFYKLKPEQLLVAHDELDLPPGEIKLKKGGGHGGHNGLRDISANLGAEYLRLRVGVGHPGHRDQVVNYVLARPSISDRQDIEKAIERGADALPVLLADGLAKAMNSINGSGKKAKQSKANKQEKSVGPEGEKKSASGAPAQSQPVPAVRPKAQSVKEQSKKTTLKDLWPSFKPK